MGLDPSDARVIEQSLTDPTRFEVIFDRHYEEIYRFTTRAIGSPGVDLAQEVFLVAYEDRARFRPEAASARPWLFGIARNVLRRWYRTETRRRLSWRRATVPELDVDVTADAIDRVSAGAKRDRLRAALRQLPESEREVVQLLALADLSYGEIAKLVGAPVGTVKSRLHRARQRLRPLLSDPAQGATREEGRADE